MFRLRGKRMAVLPIFLVVVLVIGILLSTPLTDKVKAAVTTVGITHANGSITAAGTINLTKPAGVQVGDVLFAQFGGGVSTRPVWTTPIGWENPYDNTASNTQEMPIFFHVVDGTEGSNFAFSPDQNFDGGWGIIALRGVDQGSPFLNESTDQSGASNTAASGAIAAWPISQNAVSLISVEWTDSGATTPSWPGGWNSTTDGFFEDSGVNSEALGLNTSQSTGVTTLSTQNVTLTGGSPTWVANQYALKVTSYPTTTTVSTVGTVIHTNGSITGGSAVTINKPTGVVAGDLLIFSFDGLCTTSGTPTWSSLPTGWTNYHTGTNNFLHTTFFYKVADGTEGSNFSFTPSLTLNGAWGIMAIRGVDPITPLLGVSANNTAFLSTTFTGNSVTWSGNKDAVSLVTLAYNPGQYDNTYFPTGYNTGPDGFLDYDSHPVFGMMASNLTKVRHGTTLSSITGKVQVSSSINANQYAIQALNHTPASPTLSLPANNATAISLTPQFQLSTTDIEGDEMQYKLDVCNDSLCSSVIRTIDQTASQVGWSGQNQITSTAYTGSATLAGATMGVHTYQTPALTQGTQYWWRGYAIDPLGTNTFSSASSTNSFFTNGVSVPTLDYPGSGAAAVSVLPTFMLRAADPNKDYVKYFIQLYDASACGGSQVGSDMDQSASQTNWQGQDQNSATAYRGAFPITNSTEARYKYPTVLLANHTYSWRAKAIDPAGLNSYSALSSCQDFTTGSSEVMINGGTTINGGSTIQ